VCFNYCLHLSTIGIASVSLWAEGDICRDVVECTNDAATGGIMLRSIWVVNSCSPWSRDRFCPKHAVKSWTQVVNLWFWRLPSCSCMTNEKKLGENDGNEGNKVLTLLIFCSIINHQCPRALLPVSYMYLQFYGITYRLVFVLFVSLHRKFGTP